MQEALDAHLTVVNICSLQIGQATEGVTADLEKKLKSRKKSSPDQTEEARWKEIYGLLFPNAVVPNPCKSIVCHIITEYMYYVIPMKRVNKIQISNLSKKIARNPRTPEIWQTMKSILVKSFHATLDPTLKTQSTTRHNIWKRTYGAS